MRLPAEFVKKLKKGWIWVAVLVGSAAIWLFAFYWAAQTPSDKKLFIWVGAPSQISVSSEARREITELAEKHGMKEVEIHSYDPSDGYYAAAFAMQAMSTDIYILERDEALAEAEAGVFAVLDEGILPDEEGLVFKGRRIGVRYFEN